MSILQGALRPIGKILTVNAFMGLNFGIMTILVALIIWESDSQPVGLWIALFILVGMTGYTVRSVIEDWRRPDSRS